MQFTCNHKHPTELLEAIEPWDSIGIPARDTVMGYYIFLLFDVKPFFRLNFDMDREGCLNLCRTQIRRKEKWRESGRKKQKNYPRPLSRNKVAMLSKGEKPLPEEKELAAEIEKKRALRENSKKIAFPFSG